MMITNNERKNIRFYQNLDYKALSGFNRLFLIIILSLVQAFSGIANAAPTSEVPSGSSTESDPYLISSLNNLYWLSQTPSEWCSGKYFKQTADIDAASTSNLDHGSGKTFIYLRRNWRRDY